MAKTFRLFMSSVHDSIGLFSYNFFGFGIGIKLASLSELRNRVFSFLDKLCIGNILVFIKSSVKPFWPRVFFVTRFFFKFFFLDHLVLTMTSSLLNPHHLCHPYPTKLPSGNHQFVLYSSESVS